MKIHLGKSPLEPIGAPRDPGKEYFPTFHIEESDHKGLAKVPDSGKATIRFKVIDRHLHERDNDGEKEKGTSLTIEVRSFEIEPRRDKPKGNSDAREAFSKWADDEDDVKQHGDDTALTHTVGKKNDGTGGRGIA